MVKEQTKAKGVWKHVGPLSFSQVTNSSVLPRQRCFPGDSVCLGRGVKGTEMTRVTSA